MRGMIALILFAVAHLLNTWPAAAAEPSQKAFIWKVESKQTTAYLLGSVHFAKPDIYPLNPKIERAFENSSKLAVEADIGTSNAPELLAQIMTQAFYPPGETLEQHVSQKTLEQVGNKLKEYGLTPAAFQTFKPWFLAFSILALELKKLGISPEHGIDLYFINKAKDKQKQVVEMESAQEQIELLNSFTDQEQELFLLSTFEDLKRTEQHLSEMIDSWRSGDARRLETFMVKYMEEDKRLQPIYKKLLDDRNDKMLAKIEGFLKSKDTYFVVVGAGHMVGKKGLLQLLKQKGHRLEQL